MAALRIFTDRVPSKSAYEEWPIDNDIIGATHHVRSLDLDYVTKIMIDFIGPYHEGFMPFNDFKEGVCVPGCSGCGTGPDYSKVFHYYDIRGHETDVLLLGTTFAEREGYEVVDVGYKRTQMEVLEMKWRDGKPPKRLHKFYFEMTEKEREVRDHSMKRFWGLETEKTDDEMLDDVKKELKLDRFGFDDDEGREKHDRQLRKRTYDFEVNFQGGI